MAGDLSWSCRVLLAWAEDEEEGKGGNERGKGEEDGIWGREMQNRVK